MPDKTMLESVNYDKNLQYLKNIRENSTVVIKKLYAWRK